LTFSEAMMQFVKVPFLVPPMTYMTPRVGAGN